MLAHIKDYLQKTRWTILFLALVTFVTHESTLFFQRFGIDTDIIMQGMHHFNQTGRQGLVWLAGLLCFEWFNLYYVQALNLLFLAAAPVAFGYLFYWVEAQSICLNVSLLVLGLSFIVSPFWAAQIYFLNQSA